MTIHFIANTFKKTFTPREMIIYYTTSESDLEKEAFGIALGDYPFN